MIIVRPNLYVPGTVIRSAEVNDDFDTIYNDYNGNITNANVSDTAGIQVHKLEAMPTGNIVFGNAGVPTNGAMGGDATIGATGLVTVTGGSGSVSSVITNDDAANATMYPTWVTANTGSLPLKVSSTRLRWNPNNGALGGTLTIPTLTVTTVNAATIPVYSAHPAFTIDTQIVDKKYVDDNFVPVGTVANHVHSAAAGQGGNSITLGGGYLTTGVLDTPSGINFSGHDIYEYATKADHAALQLNYYGYNNSNSYYRSVSVYDGKTAFLFGISGGAAGHKSIDANADFYTQVTDSANPVAGYDITGSKTLSADRMVPPRSVAKAWATFYFAGVAPGNATILHSYNIASITFTNADAFGGTFEITFAKPMSSANYSVQIGVECFTAGTGNEQICAQVRRGTKTAALFQTTHCTRVVVSGNIIFGYEYNGVAGTITDIAVFGTLDDDIP